MFVGFIAVVVILLVIVGLMATGATSGSGGVDQTKATKAISEISALAQSAGFFKTTTTNSNYSGISNAALVTAGIVASADTAVPTGETLVGGDTSIVVTDTLIKSKAVPGLYYKVVPAAGNLNFFSIEIAGNSTLTPGLQAALETTYSKLDFNPGIDLDNADADKDGTTGKETVSVVKGAVTDDGAASIYFN